MVKRKTELLAPAGNLRKLKCALAFGADAVYCGVPDFSLRSRLQGFNEKEILEAIALVHRKRKKIYLTLNIFAREWHLAKLREHLRLYEKQMPDAFIVSDLGVMEVLREVLPQATIHLSTQANTTNSAAVKFWQRWGIKRVVLARELSLGEIAAVHRAAPAMELEVFVHGAMCMAYSGRCFLSAWQVGGRSSNLGDCAQSCRWRYELVEEKRPDEPIVVEENPSQGTYFLNAKDLCLLEHLDELRAAGVTSFKIEGRAKSVAYVAEVVRAYRCALDISPRDSRKKVTIKKIRRDLDGIVNRGYTTGFLFGEAEGVAGLETRFSHTSEKFEFVGEVMAVDHKRNLVKIRVHNALKLKDKVRVLQPRDETYLATVMGIYDDKNFEKLASAHGGQEREVWVKIKKMPKKYSILGLVNKSLVSFT